MFKNYLNSEYINLKQFVLDCLNSLGGQEIVYIDIRKKYSITDLMIICTGQSNRHVISIAQDITYKLRKISSNSYKIEGLQFGDWILIDLESIIIHIMQKETRILYDLEKLWS